MLTKINYIKDFREIPKELTKVLTRKEEKNEIEKIFEEIWFKISQIS